MSGFLALKSSCCSKWTQLQNFHKLLVDLTTIIMDPGSLDFKMASWKSVFWGRAKSRPVDHSTCPFTQQLCWKPSSWHFCESLLTSSLSQIGNICHRWYFGDEFKGKQFPYIQNRYVQSAAAVTLVNVGCDLNHQRVLTHISHRTNGHWHNGHLMVSG